MLLPGFEGLKPLLLPKEQKKCDLKHWDISFGQSASGRKICLQCGRTSPYFPQVLDGLFPLKRLFGASITAADGQAPVWHEDVRYFQIADETGDAIAYFIWIPTVAQPEAGWGVDYCIGRAKLLMKWHDHHQKPVAYLVCNQTLPRWQA